MASTTRLLVLVPLLLAAAACGGDDGDTGQSTSDADTPTATTEPGETAQDEAAQDEAAQDKTAQDETAQDGEAAATLTLANGETYEFPTVLCTLEPQMAAGSEILFTATSYDDPGLDITQFGNEGTITEVASISVYDGDFETLWEANSMFGSAVELTLDGNTIRGTASFLERGEMANEAVDGEVVANC